MALCHSLASYGATLPSFLVSTRNQSKSDSLRAFLSPLLAAPSQLLIAFQRSTMLVLLCAALSPFAKLSPLTPSRTISSSDRPFYPRSGNSTRLQLFRTMARQQGASGTAESSGWRQVCIFTRRPPTPIRACITAVLSTRRRVRVLFTRVVRSPVQFLHDNLYEKYFPPFPRHRRCFPSREESSRKCRPSNYRPGFAARTSGWAKIPSTRLKAATKRGKEFPS